MKIKDEKHAIELTIPIWEFLAETGSNNKIEYDVKLCHFTNYCPLCDFFEVYCGICSLYINKVSCISNRHPYFKWAKHDGDSESSKKIRITQAKKIVKILKKRLKEIQNGNTN